MLELAAAPGNHLALGLVKLILDSMPAQESKHTEFRADQEGRAHALSRGHTPAQVAQAAEKPP